ncbi:MAG: hypothetical protein ACREOU_00625 [Candidatus Eiseniibacteriota bacterium]
MAIIKLPLPILALGGFRLRRSGGGKDAPGRTEGSRAAREPLPPLLVVEGHPDPSLRQVIDRVALELRATVCPLEDVRVLAGDPDLQSVVGLILTRPRNPRELLEALLAGRRLVPDRPVAVLAPQPTSVAMAEAIPLDPAFITPPVTVERLLFAFGEASSDSR